MGPFKKVLDFIRSGRGHGELMNEFRDLFLMFLCQASYLKTSTLDKVCESIPELNSYIVVHTPNAIGIAYYFDDYSVVSFRGNVKKEDWYRSINFMPTRYNEVLAHSGFVRTTKELKDTGMGAILEAVNQKYDSRVIYTGHSSGGAIASLLSTDVIPAEVITYGSPKVISSYDTSFNFDAINYRRYFTKHDYIRFLPPTVPFFYKHYGETICLPSKPYYRNILKCHRISHYAQSYMEHKNDSLRL